MGQVNTVSPGAQGAPSARSGADDITLIAQSNNPTAAGNTDLGKGAVQGVGPDGKTVYAATLVMRVYDGSGKTRYYANGKALPATITDESAARTFVRQQIGKGTLGELPRGDQSAFTRAAKGAPATAPKVQERLKAIADGEGDVGLRDKAGNTLATTLKAREVYRDGQWRDAGFVAERMSAYGATSRALNAQPEANGYGYLQGEYGKMRLITGRDGRVITDLQQAKARTSEMMKHGGLTTTTDAQAQTAQQVKQERQESLRGITHNDDGSLRQTTLRQWMPVIPLSKPIEKMDHVERVKYMVKEAIRVAPASAKKELQGLLTPQSLAAMGAFTGAQFLPGLNVVADGLATILLGKDVIDTGGKVGNALYKGLTAKQPYELVAAGDELSQALAHVGTVGVQASGGIAVKGLGGKSTSPKATLGGLASTLKKYELGKATVEQVNQARIDANNAHKGLTKPEQRLQRDVWLRDYKQWKALSAKADAVVARAAPTGQPIRNSKVPKGETTQSSSPPPSLRPLKQETTQQSQMPAALKQQKQPAVQQSQPPNLTPLPAPSAVLTPPVTSAVRVAPARKNVLGQGADAVAKTARQGSAAIQAKGGRVLDKVPASIETGLNRIDPKPRAGEPSSVAPSSPLPSTTAAPTSNLARFGDGLRKVAAAPGNALAGLRSKAIGAGRNFYYPNKEASLLKEAQALAGKVTALENHYQGATQRLAKDTGQVERSITAAQRFEAQANTLRQSDPARAADYSARARELATIADQKVLYGFGELGTPRFTKTLDQLEGQLTKLQAKVVEANAELGKAQSTAKDSREVMVARERYQQSLKKVDEFLGAKAGQYVEDPQVRGALAAGRPGRQPGERVSSSDKLRQSIEDLRQLNTTAESLPKPMSYAEYGAASIASGQAPTVSGYLATRADALRAIQGQVAERFDATRQLGAAEVRKSDALLQKTAVDAVAAKASNALDVGQAGVEYSELKKLYKNDLSSALNANGIRKASEAVDVMKAVKQQAQADGRGDLAADATRQLAVLERKFDYARRSTDVGAARKVMTKASASVERADAAAVRATKQFQSETDQLAPLRRELLATQQAMRTAAPNRAAAMRPHADLYNQRIEKLELRIADSWAGAVRAIEIAEHSRTLLTTMQRRVNSAESLAGLTPSKMIFKPIAQVIRASLATGWATTLGGLPLGMTKIVQNDPSVLARYNIAPAELTAMGKKGIGVVTLDGPLADISAFWQGPSLKGPTMASLIGQKGAASPSFFGATTKEGQRFNFVFTSDSAQAAQLGLGMTVGTPNLNAQWLGQFRVATVGDTLRFVSTSAHPNTRYGNNPQLEFVTTGGSGARIPGTKINLFSTAVLSTATKVNVGEIGVTTLKEAAPRRLFSVSGVPMNGKAPPHTAGYGKDEGQFGYLSKYNNIIEPNYVLREAQKNPAEMARDPFAALQPPTKWLKEKTFDVFVVAPGKMLIDPVTNGTQWLINGLRTKATDAMRGIGGTPTPPTQPQPPAPKKN
jgi:hypothetical protein